MAYFIDFEHWQIQIACDCLPVIESLRGIFDFRFGVDRQPDKTLLVCAINCDDQIFYHLQDRIDFNGPRVDVSPGVTIDYAFDGPLTWLQVTHTAIIAFDNRNPADCQVWLAPFDSSNPAGPGQDSCKPCPEAFFYPLLAEWLRTVDACLVHCGAVMINGRAVILSGPPGSGKSTHVLRMLLAGADFLADDLAILYQDNGQPYFYPLREVANVHVGSIETFPELAFIQDAPRRGDGKFMVNVPQYFGKKAVVRAPAGILLRLSPDPEAWIKACPKDHYLDHIHRMAWFASRPEGNKAHFWLLTDWLMNCEQWYVSQGYLGRHMETLINRLRGDLRE
jgi:hypothetical protein